MTRTATTIVLAGLIASGCSHRESTPTAKTPNPNTAAESTAAPHEMAVASRAETDDGVVAERFVPDEIPGLEWSADVETLRLNKTAVVRAEPSKDAERIGLVTRGTRVKWWDHVETDDCDNVWIEIDPRGWVCVPVTPSTESASTEKLPRLRGKRRVPGTYGRVRRGGLIYANKKALLAGEGRAPSGDTVALSRVVTVDGKRYWRTRNGQYVESAYVGRYGNGSAHQGVKLGPETGLTLPIAFAVSRKGRGRDEVAVRARPTRSSRIVTKLKRRAVVSVRDRSPSGDWVRIGADQWVSVSDLRIVEKHAAPSAEISKERWLDVDLDRQIAVAYEGETPVYATLVSTGKYRHRTPLGVFRVDRKKSLTTMNSQQGAKESYSVANVPWTLFFHKGYALHAAFWHDGFGSTRSHGCVNLSPPDAKWVYEFLGPEMPAGWSWMTANQDFPGSAVRVRNERNPVPEFRGYAAQMEQADAGDSGALARND